MQLNIYRPAQLRELLTHAYKRNDKLELFVLGNAQEEMEKIHESNFSIALDTAAEIGLDYVYFGIRDLAGCSRMMIKNNPGFSRQPAIWSLAENLGIRGGCGNGDQFQINGYHQNPHNCESKSILCDGRDYFGPGNIGAWDITNRRRLTVDEEFNKSFAYISERDEKRKEYYAKYTSVPRRPQTAW